MTRLGYRHDNHPGAGTAPPPSPGSDTTTDSYDIRTSDMASGRARCRSDTSHGREPARGDSAALDPPVLAWPRYLAVLLVTLQLSPAIPRRKQPETANVITPADNGWRSGM